jgi:hypothetical protein
MPMIGGAPPVTFGNTAYDGAGKKYYVNPTTGSDGNKGTSMAKPLATIPIAYGKCTSNNHDMIVLSATSGHAQTAEITVAKNRVHFFGMDAVGRYLGQRSRVTMGVTTTAGTIAIVQNTGVGVTFQNIKFDSADTLATSLYAFADGGEFTRIIGCEFVKSTDLDQVTSGVFLCNGDSAHYSHCNFGETINTVSVNRPAMKMNRTTIAGKVARSVMIEDCNFLIKTSSTDSALIHGTGATDVERFLILKNCIFFNSVLSSADPDQAIEFDAALTQGRVLVMGGGEIGCTALSTTTGVWSLGPTGAAAGGSAVQCT